MRDKIISISFVLIIATFGIINIIAPDILISESERRNLEQLPEITFDSVMDTSYMEKLDSYLLDQFILRDTFRSIKANVNYNLLLQLDNNDIYIKDDYIFKTEYPTNYDSIKNFNNKINDIISNIPNENIFIGIIPDKNYYLNEQLFLQIDYEYLFNYIKENNNASYIDLTYQLTLDDYYKTDTHFKQESLKPIVDTLSQNLNFNYNFNYTYNQINDFYGVYYGQAALNLKPDVITYLTSESINTAKVNYLDETGLVYTLNKDTLDKYEIYLNGAQPFIEIINENANSNKELVIFRDSFSSSLTPLLIESYTKITLIDTRYITSDIYNELITFDNQDILFLYSTLIVNNSSTLKN